MEFHALVKQLLIKIQAPPQGAWIETTPVNTERDIMKKLVLTAALTAIAALAAAPAMADEKLAKEKGCMGCHAVDKKLVGPAYKEVAAKYKGDAKAPAMLAAKVIKGGSGTWGAIPMPANKVTDAEAAKLVKWVLTQK